MEHLTLEDPPPAQQIPVIGPGPGLGPGPPPQLPPQMFTTAAQLLDLTDKKLMVSLRDGRKFIGVLRSWDQFANLVLQSTIERIFVPPPSPPTPTHTSHPPTSTSPAPSFQQQPGLYADIPRGIFLVRGENVLLLGEIDLDKDDDDPPGYQRGEVTEVEKLARERREGIARREKARGRRLVELGFGGEVGEGV